MAKSDLIPIQEFSHLGLQFSTVDWVVRPSTDSVDRLPNSIRALFPRTSESARTLAHILGSTVSFVPSARVAWRHFQRDFRERWSQKFSSCVDQVPLGPGFQRTTARWLQPTSDARGSDLSFPPASREFHGRQPPGLGRPLVRTPRECGLGEGLTSPHINSLELIAVFRALKSLSECLPSGHIRA